MTAKEKALDLFEKYDNTLTYLESRARVKECLKIMVNELIKCTPSFNIYPPNLQSIHPRVKEYWQEVEKEIQKL